MELTDEKVQKLQHLIRDSFRVQPNHEPVYVDTGNHLERLQSRQHQVLFGRRGSGKSCLLVHFQNQVARKQSVHPIYVNLDEIKTLEFPDVLIRLVLSVMEQMPHARGRWRRVFRIPNKIQQVCDELRMLLDMAATQDVTERRGRSAQRAAAAAYQGSGISSTNLSEHEKTAVFEESKLQHIERHLQDYKSALAWSLNKSKPSTVFVLLDDFYLLPKDRQPDVLDYMHRLFRGTNFYLKIATIRHRSTLSRNDRNRTIGVELFQDVEELNLDRTLEDFDATRDYLQSMLDWMGRTIGIDEVSNDLFNPAALHVLTLASGGVPRDFLNIFVEAVDASITAGSTKWLTPTYVWKGAHRLLRQTKLLNLRSDASDDDANLERLFRDIVDFCLKEKKKTAFLVGLDDGRNHRDEHELIQQLMDFKLIHIIEPDTSAASGREGRYEAYTLDFVLFMEPRRRNIEHVEFWRVDDNRRRHGVREAPIYEMSRARFILSTDDGRSTETVIDEVQEDETA